MRYEAWQGFQAIVSRKFGVQQMSGFTIEGWYGFERAVLARTQALAEGEHGHGHVGCEGKFAAHDGVEYHDGSPKTNGLGRRDLIGCGRRMVHVIGLVHSGYGGLDAGWSFHSPCTYSM